jgi:predicted nucleotidyltransferase
MNHGLSDATVAKICGVLARFPAVEKAVLCGSRARGNYKKGSDIDLTLFGDSLTSELCSTIESELDDLLLPYTIDLSVFRELADTELQEHIAHEGVILYERDVRLNR